MQIFRSGAEHANNSCTTTRSSITIRAQTWHEPGTIHCSNGSLVHKSQSPATQATNNDTKQPSAVAFVCITVSLLTTGCSLFYPRADQIKTKQWLCIKQAACCTTVQRGGI